MTLKELEHAEHLRRSMNSITKALGQGEKRDPAEVVTLMATTDDADEDTVMYDIVVEAGEFVAYLRHLQEKREAALRKLGVDIP